MQQVRGNDEVRQDPLWVCYCDYDGVAHDDVWSSLSIANQCAGILRPTSAHICMPRDMLSKSNFCVSLLTSDVQARKPERWFAIDDDLSGWPNHLVSQLVKTDGATGISPSEVQQVIRSILMSW